MQTYQADGDTYRFANISYSIAFRSVFLSVPIARQWHDVAVNMSEKQSYLDVNFNNCTITAALKNTQARHRSRYNGSKNARKEPVSNKRRPIHKT